MEFEELITVLRC